MNAGMIALLDQLAQREREEEPGYMEILPPLQAETVDFAEPSLPPLAGARQPETV
jgi:hypothetical protein